MEIYLKSFGARKKRSFDAEQHSGFYTMSCTTMSTRGLGQLVRGAARRNSLPAFLVPALALPHKQSHQFSTSSPNRSRIGGAPVSIPSEVSLKFTDIPPTSVRSRDTEIPKTKVDIIGPLGRGLNGVVGCFSCC